MGWPHRGGGVVVRGPLGWEEGLGGGAQAKGRGQQEAPVRLSQGRFGRTGRPGEPRWRATLTRRPGAARPAAPGASGVHLEGDREPQRQWGACRTRLRGSRSRAAGLRSPCSHSAHRDALRVPSPRGRRHPPADTQQRGVQVPVLLSRCEPRCLWRPCRPVTFHVTFCTSG